METTQYISHQNNLFLVVSQSKWKIVKLVLYLCQILTYNVKIMFIITLVISRHRPTHI